MFQQLVIILLLLTIVCFMCTRSKPVINNSFVASDKDKDKTDEHFHSNDDRDLHISPGVHDLIDTTFFG